MRSNMGLFGKKHALEDMVNVRKKAWLISLFHEDATLLLRQGRQYRKILQATVQRRHGEFGVQPLVEIILHEDAELQPRRGQDADILHALC